jgi:hypothetical protein
MRTQGWFIGCSRAIPRVTVMFLSARFFVSSVFSILLCGGSVCQQRVPQATVPTNGWKEPGNLTPADEFIPPLRS